MRRQRRSTTTSNFGVGRRESHDASGFYERFTAPTLSDDSELADPQPLREPLIAGDAREMSAVADGSVALVITSPPYFAGKQYEEELSRDGVPGSYLEYLDLLSSVFGECERKLEPGGRIAVNVANLGRKPYRSLSADVIRIFEDLGLLLRGEVIWEKGEGASGSCAWGSFRSATNPVLRDITERVVIASKGRFDRARTVREREAGGHPALSTISSDEFMEATLDRWRIAPESAKRVGHPAPFPVELPERLIRLYTYENDLVLDPFMGSGSALVAAAKTSRRYAGYDLDSAYVDIARARVAEAERVRSRDDAPATSAMATPLRVDVAATDPHEDSQARATREGKKAADIAAAVLENAGFTIGARNRRVRGLGVVIDLLATDQAGIEWHFDLSGAFTTTKRGGLLRTDSVWKSLGRAHVLSVHGFQPVVLLTSHLPRPKSEGDKALHAAGPSAAFDAIEMLSADGQARLERYAQGGEHLTPLPGYWSDEEIERVL